METHRQENVPVLKPSSLFTERASRDKSRLKAYNQILDQIYTKIKAASKIPGNTWILYTVPPFVLGLPKIDLEDCIVYLVFQLRQASYEVKYTYPNLLFISWAHHERNYILKDSPIMKAMLPPPPPISQQPPKSALASQKKRNTTSNTNNSVSFAPENETPTRARAAGEYNPPNAFLNAVSGGLGEDPHRKKTVMEDLFNF